MRFNRLKKSLLDFAFSIALTGVCCHNSPVFNHSRYNELMKKHVLLAHLLWPAILMASTDNPDGAIRIGRYLSRQPVATTAQHYPLMATVTSLRFPKRIATVETAMDYVLRDTGYQLTNAWRPPAVKSMLHARLPNNQRELGTIVITEALQTLAGPAFDLTIDPVHRLVGFTLKPQYETTFADGGTSE